MALRDKFKSHKQAQSKASDKPSEAKFKSKQLKLGKSGKVLSRLRLIMRTGHEFMIPYAMQPYIVYNPIGHIMINTHQFKVKITGRGLNKILDYLYNDQVISIKESLERIDTNNDPLYINSIELKGAVLSDEM